MAGSAECSGLAQSFHGAQIADELRAQAGLDDRAPAEGAGDRSGHLGGALAGGVTGYQWP